MTKAVGFIGGIGLIGAIFLVKLLLESNLLPGITIGIITVYLATIFGICALCVNYLKSVAGLRKTELNKQIDKQKELDPHQHSRLEAPRTPPASVTVNTTRTLDEVHLGRD
ncbi:MAG: hypothetical protein OEM82_15940 [Acidobacteriota bacterium]|nr:hypothetical protein [Acidobacteriota bacterium]MDH3530724.1 hypothetical protein [Acidobacteriota bacterium]